MSYSQATTGIDREQNLFGGLNADESIAFGPLEINDRNTEFFWDASNVAADSFRLVIGLGSGQSEFADSGIITSTTQAFSLPVNTPYFVTLYYRFGEEPWRSVYRQYTAINVAYVPSPTAAWIEGDGIFWNDAAIWTE